MSFFDERTDARNYNGMNSFDIFTFNNTNIVTYCVECFDRILTIIYTDELPWFMLSSEQAYKIIDELYDRWNEDGNGDFPCEEFIIDNLPDDFKSHISAIILECDD